MSSLRKATQQESAAYAASVTATAAVVTARMDGADESEIARLTRRAQAYRTQWLATARRLEEVALRTEA